MTPIEFMRQFVEPMLTYTVPSGRFEWKLIGRCAYLRVPVGVFKLEMWSGGSADDVTGLAGTFTSHEGAQDHVVFEFRDFMKPDMSKAGNPKLDRDVYGWSGHGRTGIEWYNAPPRPGDIEVFQAQIVWWIRTWATRKDKTP